MNGKWKKHEERTLVKCVKENEGSIENAFTKAAELINRTEKACACRYYGHLRSKQNMFLKKTSERKQALIQHMENKNIQTEDREKSVNKCKCSINNYDLAFHFARKLTNEEKIRLIKEVL